MTASSPLPVSSAAWDAARPSGVVRRLGPLTAVVRPRVVAVTSTLIALSLVLGGVGMTVGTFDLSVGDVVAAVSGVHEDAVVNKIVLGLRLPRMVAAICAGAALGVAGAVFQSVSRNALGSPEIIGFTTGSATGAIVQIVVLDGGPFEVAASAILGGILTALVVYLLAMKGGITGGYRLILVGIGAGAVLSALNSLLLVMGDLDTAIQANLWLSGSLDARNWSHASAAAVGVVVLVPIIAVLARRASLIEMGDDVASQLGVRVERTRIALILTAVLLVGSATGAVGPIAFVSLATPQLVVRLTRGRGMPVIGAAAMGALLLVAADILTQLLPVDMSVPIGRVTGIIGGVYLIWLLLRSKQV